LSEEVRKLGTITGNTEKAGDLARFIDNIHILVKSRIDNNISGKRPTVYYETGSDYTAAATNSGGDWLITTAGGKNIAENTTIQWVKVTPEWLIVQNPDIIIKPGNDDNESSLNGTFNLLKTRPGFPSLKAIQQNQTFILAHDILYGPQSVIGLLYVAKIIHPELFSDISPQIYLNQFTSEFIGETNITRIIYPDFLKTE
jgi:iron complex transport system substrate-binding protein